MSARKSGRHPDATRVVVRLTEPALDDLTRLAQKDPPAVRWCFKKMLLLERNPEAGEPLVGGLIQFRKLTVGDRHWRIVWRVTHDAVGDVYLDVAEVWAAGARNDDEVYDEMTERIASLGDSPVARTLADVLELLGKPAEGLSASSEPTRREVVPEWLARRLTGRGVPAAEVTAMTPEEAMTRWEAIISTPAGEQ